MMFPNRLRYFNKRFLNRFMLKFAGYSRNSFAVVRHVGRRSGKTYETPIMVESRGKDFIIALTYGPHVDWYRNLLAAGQGLLVWQGKTYTIGKPEAMNADAARAEFPLPQRTILRLLKVQHFIHVASSVVDPART
jgi:deazaflavin-dependent oxidoreductase (nitroreductase family)